MEIEKKTLGRVYSFDLKFEGGNRTKFYRKLFGFESKTKREDESGKEKVYENFYPGVVTPIPHLRLGKSVLAVPKAAQKKLDAFFNREDWGEIELYSFDGLFPSDKRLKSMRRTLGRINISDDRSLNSEIEALLELKSRNNLEETDLNRIEILLEKCNNLIKLDWSDNEQFSSELEEKLSPLKREIK